MTRYGTIYWRETTRGVRLVVRNRHYETYLGLVEVPFYGLATAEKDGYEVQKRKLGDSFHGSEKIAERIMDIEQAKVLLVQAMDAEVALDGVSHWRDNATVFLEKTVPLPGTRRMK